MDLENVMLSEVSQAGKVNKHDFTVMLDIQLIAKNEQTRRTKTHKHNNMVVTEGKGVGGGEG